MERTSDLHGVWGRAANDLFAVGANGTILHYDGISWSSQVSDTTSKLVSMGTGGANDVWAVGASGTLLHHP